MARLVCPGEPEWMYLTLEVRRATEAGLSWPEWVQRQQADLEKQSQNETHLRLVAGRPKGLVP